MLTVNFTFVTRCFISLNNPPADHCSHVPNSQIFVSESFKVICLLVNYCWCGQDCRYFLKGMWLLTFAVLFLDTEIILTACQVLKKNKKKTRRPIHIAPLTFNGQYEHLMSLCTACQKTTLKAFFQSPVNCERWRRRRGDKLWEMAVGGGNLRWGEKAREMPTQASVSECLIVQRDPFLRVCQGRPEWMPIIPPNNVPQQYFNDVPFVEKPLSSQELIGF